MSRTRTLLVSTVGATYALLLLGIYTAAIGAGLTCGARWPLCDGAVFGLFPANWTSFVEWFHRLIAMITGFMILGSWWRVWRSGTSRLASGAFTIAIVLLPLQIWLGAETVLSYEILVLTLHLSTAIVIYGGVFLGTLWVLGPTSLDSDARRRLLIGVTGLVPVVLLLTPGFLVVHTGPVQVLYYGLGLLILSGLLVVAGLPGRDAQDGAIRTVAVIGVGLVTVQLVAGRLVRTELILTIDWVAGGLTVVILMSLVVLSRGVSTRIDNGFGG